MIVGIHHPSWVNGIPKGHRTTRYVAFPTVSQVDIEEVPDDAVEVAFRIRERDHAPIQLLVRPGTDGIWWPMTGGTGRPLPPAFWASRMAKPSNDGKDEAGIGALLDKHSGWPTDQPDHDAMRSVRDDFRDENRAVVTRAAADMMICRGAVWRRRTDPVYRAASNRDDVCIGALGQAVESKLGFHTTYLVGATAAGALDLALSEDPVMASGLYFRADELDKALAAGKRRFPAEIEVLMPERIRAVVSPAYVKAAALAYFEAIQFAVPVADDRMKLTRDVMSCREAITADAPIATIVAGAKEVLAGSLMLAPGYADEARQHLGRAFRRLTKDIALGRLPAPLKPEDEEAVASLAPPAG